MTVVGIVPAGGSGERRGADRPKAFVVCAGRPLVEWSLEVLRSVCDRVVIAAPHGYHDAPDHVLGGESRSASVRNALEAAPEATVAVVHDAARPLVTRDLVKRCLDALEPGVDGAIAAAPMTDTVKEAAPDGRVMRTLDRSVLWSIQTPQVFRADVLRRALERDAAAHKVRPLVIALRGRDHDAVADLAKHREAPLEQGTAGTNDERLGPVGTKAFAAAAGGNDPDDSTHSRLSLGRGRRAVAARVRLGDHVLQMRLGLVLLHVERVHQLGREDLLGAGVHLLLTRR